MNRIDNASIPACSVTGTLFAEEEGAVRGFICISCRMLLCELTRITYQQLLNNYTEHHEQQTTMDFHHQLIQKLPKIF
jgi:hypothetical protein